MNYGPVTVTVPPEAIEAVAVRAAEIVLARLGNVASPWMTRREAAKYLRLPLSRLSEKDRRIPCHRDEGRVLYHQGELDAYFLGCGR